jgi:hypothetical protein
MILSCAHTHTTSQARRNGPVLQTTGGSSTSASLSQRALRYNPKSASKQKPESDRGYKLPTPRRPLYEAYAPPCETPDVSRDHEAIFENTPSSGARLLLPWANNELPESSRLLAEDSSLGAIAHEDVFKAGSDGADVLQDTGLAAGDACTFETPSSQATKRKRSVAQALDEHEAYGGKHSQKSIGEGAHDCDIDVEPAGDLSVRLSNVDMYVQSDEITCAGSNRVPVNECDVLKEEIREIMEEQHHVFKEEENGPISEFKEPMRPGPGNQHKAGGSKRETLQKKNQQQDEFKPGNNLQEASRLNMLLREAVHKAKESASTGFGMNARNGRLNKAKERQTGSAGVLPSKLWMEKSKRQGLRSSQKDEPNTREQADAEDVDDAEMLSQSTVAEPVKELTSELTRRVRARR